MRRVINVLLAGATLAACTDFATPAELTKPTVLAVVAEPPLVAPGEATELSIVMAGPDGPMTPDAVSWRLVETLPGVPPFGEVDGGAGAATYQAPDELPALPEGVPPVTSIEATVEADGTSVVVVKAVVVADVPAANPAIAVLAIGGEVAGDRVVVGAGETVDLDVGTDPPPGEDAAFAWYSTAGEIERYQSNPAALVVEDDGWLFVVFRDGRGGVAWRAVEVAVE